MFHFIVRIFSRLFHEKKYTFFKYHITAVVLFAVIYWIQDEIIYSYPELGTRLGYINKKSKQINSLYYWFWFSLVTQTTVGYHGPKLKKIPPNIIFTNIIQLLSILLITAYTV